MAKAKKTRSSAAPKVTPPAGGKYNRTRAVTLPTFKLAEETPVYVKVTGAMHQSNATQRPGKDGKAMEPATILPVVNVETGEVTQIICGSVLKGILTETYPDDGYVGKSFEITKHAKAQGKRYNTYSVFEIDA